jgi:hypothetical protein
VSGTLATAQQSNGALQVTYNGALLYTFVSDTSPGQVTGNGVAGFSVAKPSTSSTQAGASGGSSPAGTTTTKSGGTTTTKGGYGY